MKYLVSILVAAVLPLGAMAAVPDTLRVSDLFTTHVIFDTDLIYADISNSQVMAAKILEQSRNMMALKARTPFSVPLSVSALESDGQMHTFIVAFDESPAALVVDRRRETPADPIRTDTPTKEKKKGAALYRSGDAPLLRDVAKAPQALWHLSERRYDIEVTCTNIVSYSDITYMVFSVRNASGVSWECQDATFVVESRRRSRRGVVYDKTLFPKGRSGTASCAPRSSATIAYSLDKLSLSRDQVLRVYFYEEGGQRELVLTISAKDVNEARATP